MQKIKSTSIISMTINAWSLSTIKEISNKLRKYATDLSFEHSIELDMSKLSDCDAAVDTLCTILAIDKGHLVRHQMLQCEKLFISA